MEHATFAVLDFQIVQLVIPVYAQLAKLVTLSTAVSVPYAAQSTPTVINVIQQHVPVASTITSLKTTPVSPAQADLLDAIFVVLHLVHLATLDTF